VAIGRFAINYSSSQGFSGGFGILDAIRGTFGRPESASVSMGRARDTDNPYIRPRTVLSTVGNAAAQWATAQVLRQSARTQAAQIPVSIPQTFAAVGEQKLEPLVKEGTQSMSLDLGGLLGTLGTSYIEARYGGPRAPQIMAPTIRAQGPAAGIAATPVVGPLVAGGLGAIAGEAYDFFTEDQRAQLPGGVQISGNCPPPSYCVDGKTGKVTIKQKRRRRRRLATSSDIRDLSSLKSVLSPADLKMWIATHPS
jgi:hypothetical protein